MVKSCCSAIFPQVEHLEKPITTSHGLRHFRVWWCGGQGIMTNFYPGLTMMVIYQDGACRSAHPVELLASFRIFGMARCFG